MNETDDGPIIALHLTEQEFQQLIYALNMFHHAVTVAPIPTDTASTRSDRMKARRATNRFWQRIQDLADAYGMDKG